MSKKSNANGAITKTAIFVVIVVAAIFGTRIGIAAFGTAMSGGVVLPLIVLGGVVCYLFGKNSKDNTQK